MRFIHTADIHLGATPESKMVGQSTGEMKCGEHLKD